MRPDSAPKAGYGVGAIPLNRPEIVEFLLPPTVERRGAALEILAQRPTEAAEATWVGRLNEIEDPQVIHLLEIDHPHNHLTQTWTSRLVPVAFLTEPEFLTRNLGGWSPVYFGVMGLPDLDEIDDPLLNHLEILTDYGSTIRYFGADPHQVEPRLEEEVDADLADVLAGITALHTLHRHFGRQQVAYIERLYTALAGEEPLAHGGVPVPDLLLFDALMGQLVQLETVRRTAAADGQTDLAETIAAQQQHWQKEHGLTLILKGEYIAGRHRRSTVLIAPELKVVVKQPAPEPFHEIALETRNYNGQAENWPITTDDGAVVTPRGRLRLVVEEDIVPRLDQIFGHGIRFSTLLGLTAETFIDGPTVQERVLADPNRFTPALYDEFVLHQQVCELIGAENGDWHAANFVVREEDSKHIHIDWGAARPLRPDELTPELKLARLNQVQNIAYSFHNDYLAELVLHEHAQLLADEDRLAGIRQRAEAMVGWLVG